MPRSFFSRVFLGSMAVMLAVLLVGGYFLDDYLVEREMERLGDQVRRFALILKDDVAKKGADGSLQAAVTRLEQSTRVRFTVIDGGGRVLADSLLDPANMENHATHPEVAEALAGREGRNLRKSKSVGIEMLYVALPGEPVVRAALSVEEVRAVVRELHNRILLAAIPALLLALALAWVLAKSLTDRVGRMRVFASALEAGNFEVEIKPEGDDELSDMERSLAALRDEIKLKVTILKRDAEVLSGLVEGFPHAVLLFGADMNLALANAPARSLFRIAKDYASAMPLGEAVRNPRILEAIEGMAGGGGVPPPFVLTLGEPPGHYEVLVRALGGSGGVSDYLVILRDITRETHLERVRSDFIVSLSHELRTPLTAIRGSAETLIGAQSASREVTLKFLETIKRNSLRLEALLQDVSDLARAESSVEKTQMADFDARVPLIHSSDLFSAEAANAGIELVVTKPPTELTLVSDEGKIEQILINLLQNAVRYTPAGGRVEISVGREEGAVVYTVEDTGIGIPEPDIPRVTERFYRVDPSRSRAAGGTGLGLSIVKHLAESLSGNLSMASEVGRGTKVRVAFPSGNGGA